MKTDPVYKTENEENKEFALIPEKIPLKSRQLEGWEGQREEGLVEWGGWGMPR